jgi:protein-S-isoprenylcysteine O-methyltransferase Ste14
MVVLQIALVFGLSLDRELLFAPVVPALLHDGVALPEERYLSKRFGKPYRDFLPRTRRWL